jgi:Clp amino terminal domain, pathogenicity island component
VFERFTDQARRAVVIAQEEARALEHNYIGTEHILLGVLRVPQAVGYQALESFGASPDDVRTRVLEVVERGPRAHPGHIPFTADSKRVLEYSLREALQLGHNHIGTEHILLGLVRPSQDNIATQVLLDFGIEHSRLRQAVIELLRDQPAGPPAQLMLRANPPSPPRATSCAFCGGDLWDTRYYVIGGHAVMCQDCVENAHAAVEIAEGRGSEPGALHLPPRVSGNPPDDDAVGEIVAAFQKVFAGEAADEDLRTRPLEDVESLLPALEEAGRRYPNVSPPDISVVRVRFRSADLADVRFTVIGSPLEGPVVREAGTWKVGREACCRVLALAGVPCPPRETDQP